MARLPFESGDDDVDGADAPWRGELHPESDGLFPDQPEPWESAKHSCGPEYYLNRPDEDDDDGEDGDEDEDADPERFGEDDED